MSPNQDHNLIIFGKPQVENNTTALFLKQFGVDNLPRGRELARMMNSFEFVIDGYNDNPQEIYMIPEVREFFKNLHRDWPYWFFFCDLRTETLTMMTMCMLPTISGFKRLGQPQSAVQYDPIELIQFIQKNFAPLNSMMERAGMSETDIYNRTRDVFLYFKLPFDSPPPEDE